MARGMIARQRGFRRMWAFAGTGIALVVAMQRTPAQEASTQAGEAIPVTVTHEWPALEPFDAEVISFMRDRGIPGGALAVSRHGKLVLARGYGWADKAAKLPVSPDALFRIASVSKPITAVAVLQLLERQGGQVSLETPVFDVLDYQPHLAPSAEPDPRLRAITIRQVLQHTAGWDAEVSFDPMFRPIEIAREVGVRPPAGPDAIIRYMLGRPLDHDPGAKYAYSNFGYCVLGRLIEELSGQPYEQYVQEEVLAPLGIRRMRVGRTLLEHQALGEVRYYDPGVGENVMTPEEGDEVPAPYGTFHLEAMDAHGGWIASAPDLVRFACAFDDPESCPLLSPESIATMFARPEGEAGYEPDGTPKAAYYGCGWLVRPVGNEGRPSTGLRTASGRARATLSPPKGRANHWHNGMIAGTCSLLVRRHDGLNWAVLFNQSSDPSGLSYWDIDLALHRAADAMQEWPADDLFDSVAL